MSHYSLLKTELKDRECIKKALVRMGYAATGIELSDRPLELKMYHGASAGKTAEIRLKGAGWKGEKNIVGHYANDIGFQKTAGGTYQVHADLAGHNQQDWVNKLNKYYSAEVIKQTAEEQGLYVESEEEVNGEIFITVDSYY